MQTTSSPSADDLTLQDLVTAVWRSRWLIVPLTAFTSAGALGMAFLTSKTYEASVTVATVNNELMGNGLGSLRSLDSSLGGLASLAGLPLGGRGSSAETIATLRSETLTHRFIKENDLLPVLFASDWESATSSWRVPKPPTIWQGARLFNGRVRAVDEDGRTGLVRLSIRWKDPVRAADWANALVALANDHLRSEALTRSARNIEYLQDQLDHTSVVEVRSSIFSLMESEIRNQMLARGNESFALRVVDAAIAPELPASPQPLIWAIVGFLVGLAASVGWSLLRALRASMRQPA
jgi:uncharacterized protein involved in exopolysaccharide biosynthesis